MFKIQPTRWDTNGNQLLTQPEISLSLVNGEPSILYYKASYSGSEREYNFTGKTGRSFLTDALNYEFATAQDERLWLSADYNTLLED